MARLIGAFSQEIMSVSLSLGQKAVVCLFVLSLLYPPTPSPININTNFIHLIKTEALGRVHFVRFDKRRKHTKAHVSVTDAAQTSYVLDSAHHCRGRRSCIH